MKSMSAHCHKISKFTILGKKKYRVDSQIHFSVELSKNG